MMCSKLNIGQAKYANKFLVNKKNKINKRNIFFLVFTTFLKTKHKPYLINKA